jgi:hypothetical protein
MAKMTVIHGTSDTFLDPKLQCSKFLLQSLLVSEIRIGTWLGYKTPS